MDAVLDVNTPAQDGREPAVSVMLGVLPFALIGAGMVLFESPGDLAARQTGYMIGAVLLLGGYLVILAGVLVGWLAGFPRWFMPYLFYAALFSLYLSNVATPGVAVFGLELWGRNAWGWRAFVPLAVVILAASLLLRSFTRPLARLARTLGSDWSMLAFGFFGMLPLITVFMDEISHDFSFPVVLAAQSVLITGALLYMLLNKQAARFLALIACAALAGLIIGTGSDYFWQQYTIDFHTGQKFLTGAVPDMGRALMSGLQMAAGAVVVFLIPLGLWFVGLVSRGKRRDRVA